MTTHPPQDKPEASRGTSGPPTRDAGVQRQLAQFFGESLFGPWPALKTSASTLHKRRRTPGKLGFLLVVLAFAALVVSVRALIKPKLGPREDPRREQYIQDLNSFYGDGNLERASEFVQLVQQLQSTKHPNAATKGDAFDLIVAVQAALYRYFDAAPVRLRQIQPYLDDARNASPLYEIARLTVLSRGERAAKRGQLQQLYDNGPDHNEINYLLATALEHRLETQASREAWARDAKLQPAWLEHRFEQAWFEARQERFSAATDIATEMLHLDPNSRWSKAAAKFFGVPADVILATRSDATAPSDCPVRSYFESLVHAISGARGKDWQAAEEFLRRAVLAVNFEAPFLFDAFDWCIEQGVPSLARDLTQLPEWPHDSAVAKAKVAQLSDMFPLIEGSEAPTRMP
jgi:hypothetical protein